MACVILFSSFVALSLSFSNDMFFLSVLYFLDSCCIDLIVILGKSSVNWEICFKVIIYVTLVSHERLQKSEKQ